MKIEEGIKKRKSVRDFSNKKPDWKKIIKAIDASRYAPMAGGQFSLNFILVSDKEKIKKLEEASEQYFFSKVHYVVIVLSDEARVKRSYLSRGEKFAKEQSGAGIENFLLELTSQKLSTCWVGYFDEDKVKQVLDIPKDINVVAFFPIGFESDSSKKKK
jgi:nitroreductase